MDMGEQMTGTERFTAQSFETAAVAEQIRLVPPAMARPFQGHTFQIRDDTGMKRLMKSLELVFKSEMSVIISHIA